MSNTTDKMLDRYVYLHIDYNDWSAEKEEKGMTIHVKLDDEGVVVDAWQEDEVIATTCKTYNDMGIEVKEILELPWIMVKMSDLAKELGVGSLTSEQVDAITHSWLDMGARLSLLNDPYNSHKDAEVNEAMEQSVKELEEAFPFLLERVDDEL